MSNTYTKNFQDTQGLSEADLNTAFTTVKPSLDNLSLAAQGTTAFQILRSNGTATAPVWSNLNTIINNTTISSTAANALINAVTTVSSTAANAIFNSTARSVGSSVTSIDIALSTGQVSIINTSTTLASIPGTTVSITTSGRPVRAIAIPSNSSSNASFTVEDVGGGVDTLRAVVALYRDSTDQVGRLTFGCANDEVGGVEDLSLELPLGVIEFFDTPAAGTYTYELQIAPLTADTQISVSRVKLLVYEL